MLRIVFPFTIKFFIFLLDKDSVGPVPPSKLVTAESVPPPFCS